jgi:phosphoenolpyruvate carboxykinase (GTP)
VARTEHQTFVCSEDPRDAGINNNWIAPAEARRNFAVAFRGCMRGRTLYVVPFLMGPPGSPFAKVGVQVTDSLYVVLNMRIMTRMGVVALDHLGESSDFTRCLHSLGDLSPERRAICHFPEANEVMSFGSGYGGNALLGKKCLALRLASWMGWREGWLAEHMLIVAVTSPAGAKHYVAGAFPSACGKTNLAMLQPPEGMSGWKVETIGDDIAWLRPGPDGRLHALNPEAGFFGVAPGTSSKTNPNAMAAIARNTIFTNVALKPDGTVWWEGHDDEPVDGMLDWQGRPWNPASGEKAAHPNSRFTTPARECPCLAPEWEAPDGVPISAILFGARRRELVPLVFEASSWTHGTYLGATLASETTAAATGPVGRVRRDSMAMQPFCGYDFGDYFGHWLAVGQALTRPPKVFCVNWFRTDDQGRFLWPGFRENLRVLRWIIERCEGSGLGTKSPLGWLPAPGAIAAPDGVNERQMAELWRVDTAGWRYALRLQNEYFSSLGDRVPDELWCEQDSLFARLLVQDQADGVAPHPGSGTDTQAD